MKHAIVLLFTSLLLLSCSDEGTTYPSNNPLANPTTGVKSKKIYPNLESNQIMSVEDFEYNSLNRLQKRISYGGNREIIYEYDEYYYDGNGLLIKTLYYYSNIYSPSGFNLLKSTVDTYSNSFLISERDTFPLAGYTEENRYEYQDGLPVHKLFYHNGNLESKTVYAYQNGRLHNELFCDTTGKTVSSIEYICQSSFFTEARQYASNGDLSTDIRYSYDKNGKLILENVQVISFLSSSISHVVRYEY